MSENETSSTGFDIIERLLQEGQATGRSATLDSWMAEAKQRIASLGPSDQATKVKKAYEAAADVVNSILSGQIQPVKAAE